MSHIVCTCSIVLALLVASSSAFAQTDADIIRERVTVGQRVVVTDDQGQESDGKIDALRADALSLEIDGQTRDVSYDGIIRIDGPRDGVWDGALIGFGVGAAVGTAVACTYDCYFAIMTVPFLGARLALLGSLIDALVHRDPEIYQRGRSTRVSVGPMRGPSLRAAAVTVSW